MNPAAVAKACLAIATGLQQLAAALEAEPDRATLAELRAQVTDPPASVAEPECGCSLYARCDRHEVVKPRGCTCNGPQYASSSCPVKDGTGLRHAELAHQYPDRDPALAD